MASRGKIVAWQLGREPEIDFEVALDCPYGWPAVLRSAPFTRSGRPNPNLYYLSCPYLRRRIAVIEDEGAIRRLETLIREDTSLRASVVEAQRAHESEWRLLSGMPVPPVRSALIAGASEPLALKCLHAHHAWGLAHPGYGLDDMISDLIGEEWCADEPCRQAAEDTGTGATG